MSSFDADSFVSAQDTVADLRDFEDLNEILQVLNNFTIWSESIRLNAKNRIMALVTLHIFSHNTLGSRLPTPLMIYLMYKFYPYNTDTETPSCTYTETALVSVLLTFLMAKINV